MNIYQKKTIRFNTQTEKDCLYIFKEFDDEKLFMISTNMKKYVKKKSIEKILKKILN